MYKNNVHGILLLDKPAGISSNKILQKIKKMFDIKKVGYVGTLDPLATGVLPICLGVCTKLSDYLMNSNKLYYTVIKLGQITSTYDSQGVILEKRKVNFSNDNLYQSIHKLTGLINQIVPMYSAVKYQGLPLYKYAIKNFPIIKIVKNIYIYNINCIKYDNEFMHLKIYCSKGTYIRTLVHDLGKLLQCGAHVYSLRRIQVSSYKIKDCINFVQLTHLNKIYFNNFFGNVKNNFFISFKKVFYTLPKITFYSIDILYKKNKICLFPQLKSIFFRIVIKNYKKLFIFAKTDYCGTLILCKLLNI